MQRRSGMRPFNRMVVRGIGERQWCLSSARTASTAAAVIGWQGFTVANVVGGLNAERDWWMPGWWRE